MRLGIASQKYMLKYARILLSNMYACTRIRENFAILNFGATFKDRLVEIDEPDVGRCTNVILLALRGVHLMADRSTPSET